MQPRTTIQRVFYMLILFVSFPSVSPHFGIAATFIIQSIDFDEVKIGDCAASSLTPYGLIMVRFVMLHQRLHAIAVQAFPGGERFGGEAAMDGPVQPAARHLPLNSFLSNGLRQFVAVPVNHL